MPRYSTTIPSWTTAADPDTDDIADNKHHTIRSASATGALEMRELYLSGQATSSAVQVMSFGRTSQIASGTLVTTGVYKALISAISTAPGTVPDAHAGSATNKVQRSSTLGHLLPLGFNAFGGIVRWVNGPDELISTYGNTASLAELSLNGFTGTSAAAIQTGMIFEVI